MHHKSANPRAGGAGSIGKTYALLNIRLDKPQELIKVA